MNAVRTTIPFLSLLASVVIGLLPGCERAPATWNSSRMAKLKSEWDQLAKKETKTNEEYEELQDSLDRLLAESLSEQDIDELAATCAVLPRKSKERSDFDTAVLQYVIRSLVDARDRNRLVQVLSTRCLSRVYPRLCIEFYLAYNCSDKLSDPIMILGEAYTQCRDPVVREELASAVRRGFADCGIEDKDDEGFVKNAMRWYEQEKGSLVVNELYSRNETRVPFEFYEEAKRNLEKFPFAKWKLEPLFLKKSERDAIE